MTIDEFFLAFENFAIWFSNFIEGTVNGLVGILNDLYYVIELTSKFVLEIPSYLMWLPDEVRTVLLVAFGVVVIYKVLGREG